MDHFHYEAGQLYCEDVSVDELARTYGTPLYVYSTATLRTHYQRLTEAFAPLNPRVCYSVKSLSTLAILRLFREWGSGFDVVSGGELHRALTVGADPKGIVFAGVGKTDAEIDAALEAGIGWFNIESEAELHNLAERARAMGMTAHGALRVNPDVDSDGTPLKTLTGKAETKFGVDWQRAIDVFRQARGIEGVELDAIHMHIGSPIYQTQPYVHAVNRALELVDKLAAEGIAITTLDLGGGFAAFYEDATGPDLSAYAEAIAPILQNHPRGKDLQVILEPGRSLVANAGVLLTRVLYRKAGGSKKFVIVDAGMNDLIRPTLYEAYHFVWPTQPTTQPPSRAKGVRVDGDECVDVVGPVCESGDYLAKDRHLPRTERGDLLAVFSAGAYGSVMASRYNSRGMPAEVLVEGSQHKLIRRRERLDDLIAHEV